MRIRRYAPGVMSAAVVMVAAGACWAQPMFGPAAACRASGDPSICLLKVASMEDGGAMAARDDVLRRAPDVLRAAGISPEAAARQRAESDSSETFFGDSDEVEAALDASLALDRAGEAPGAALAPVLGLPMQGRPVPPFFAGGYLEMPPPRIAGLIDLLGAYEQGIQASTGLRRAAAEALEAEARRSSSLSIADASGASLAIAYRRMGDDEASERSLRLIRSPTERIAALAASGQDSRAVDELIALRVEDLLSAEKAKMDELRATSARLYGRSTPSISNAELRESVESDFAETKRSLLRTLSARKSAEARRLADHLIQQRDRPVLLRDLAPVASPAVVTAELEREEARLTAGGKAGQLSEILSAWAALGRTDRVDLLVARTTSWARDNAGYRASLIDFHIRQGEVAAVSELGGGPEAQVRAAVIGDAPLEMDRRLAAAPDEGAQLLVLSACTSTARDERRWATLVRCFQAKSAYLQDARRRYFLAEEVLGAAALTADLEVTESQALFDLAVELGASAEAAGAGPDGGRPPRSSLLAVAKAQLRAEGRLARMQRTPPL